MPNRINFPTGGLQGLLGSQRFFAPAPKQQNQDASGELLKLIEGVKGLIEGQPRVEQNTTPQATTQTSPPVSDSLRSAITRTFEENPEFFERDETAAQLASGINGIAPEKVDAFLSVDPIERPRQAALLANNEEPIILEDTVERQKTIDTHWFEGFRSHVYRDSVGVKTVGIGTNLERPDSDLRPKFESLGLDLDAVRRGEQGVTEEQARALADEDLVQARSDARDLISNFDEHPEVLQDVFTDLTYNLGKGGFRRFRNTRAAFERKDYEAAARGLRNSKWFNQVGRRSRIIVNEVLRQA